MGHRHRLGHHHRGQRRPTHGLDHLIRLSWSLLTSCFRYTTLLDLLHAALEESWNWYKYKPSPLHALMSVCCETCCGQKNTCSSCVRTMMRNKLVQGSFLQLVQVYEHQPQEDPTIHGAPSVECVHQEVHQKCLVGLEKLGTQTTLMQMLGLQRLACVIL